MRTHTYSDLSRGLSDHALICTFVPVICRDLVHSDFTLFTLGNDLSRRVDDTPTYHSNSTPPNPPPTTTPHTTSEVAAAHAGSSIQPPTAPQEAPAIRKQRYIWIGGEDTIEYMNSAKVWKAHTSTDQFAAKFLEITMDHAANNDRKTEIVEEFLLAEAITAGVVKAIEIRPRKNPNRWAKHLAPWYNELCREAKREYR